MNLAYFISKRIGTAEKKSFSSTIHRIAIASIGLGLAVMIISFLIMKGFQHTVTDKIYSFSSHFQVTKFAFGSVIEEPPMDIRTPLYTNYEDFGVVDHVQEYAHKAGLIKTESEVLGIIFKGVGESFDVERIRDFITEGEFISFKENGYSQDVMLSTRIADKLNISVGDPIIVHFFQDPPRSRRLTVRGLYETNLTEYFDDKVILGDIDLIRRLNNWSDTYAGGLEIFVKDLNRLDESETIIQAAANHDQAVERVSDKYIQVFEWLNLIGKQVNVFLIIILIVVCVNMISIVIILIMERTTMIGTLKALGSGDSLIRRVFGYSGIRLVFRGLILGNLIGIGLCALQYQLKLITLNPQDYYMSVVPIGWNWEIVILLNLLTLIVVGLVLLIPTMIISGIRPISSIRFD